jgi:hypothetical protein
MKALATKIFVAVCTVLILGTFLILLYVVARWAWRAALGF